MLSFFSLCIGFFLCYVCYCLKHSLEEKGRKETPRYAFYNGAFEMLLLFSFVAAFYGVLAFVVSDRGSDQITLEALRRYERWVQALQSVLKEMKLSPTTSAGLLAGCLLVAWVFRTVLNRGDRSEQVEKGYAIYESYGKWLKRATLAVTLLSSFTFFGGEVNALNADLRVRIRTMKENYNAVALEVEEAIEEGVAAEAHTQLLTNQPEYEEQLQEYERARKELQDAYDEYQRMWQRYEYTSPKLDAVVNKWRQTNEKIAALATVGDTSRRAEPRDVVIADKLAKEITPAKLTDVQASIQQQRSDHAARLQTVLNTPLGGKLPSVLVEDRISHEKIFRLKGLALDIPALQPILQLLEDTIAKKAELKIKEWANRVLEKCMARPRTSAAKEIELATKSIAREVRPDWNAARSHVTREPIQRLQLDVFEIRAATQESKTNQSLRIAEINRETRTLSEKLERQFTQLRLETPVSASKQLTEMDRIRESLQARQRPNPPSSQEVEAALKSFLKEVNAKADPAARRAALQQAIEGIKTAPGRTEAFRQLSFVAQNHFQNNPISSLLPEMRPLPPNQSRMPGQMPGPNSARPMIPPKPPPPEPPPRPMRMGR